MGVATTWKPIVAAIGGSGEAAHAASFARNLARSAGTECYVVHAVPDPWTSGATQPTAAAVVHYRKALADRARDELIHQSGSQLSAAGALTVRVGRPVCVLQQMVDELGAELIVLGGKRHTGLDHWSGGSTTLNAVRLLSVPVLVVRHPPPRLQRVLAAVDVSPAAAPTLAAAERLARAFGATLRVVTVVEPVPPSAGPTQDAAKYYSQWERIVRREIWPLIHTPAEAVVRHGPATETVEQEAAAWPADLLVVGSHGRAWVDGLVLGTLTESLLNRLPTSMLVVPVSQVMHQVTRPAATRHRERAAPVLV